MSESTLAEDRTRDSIQLIRNYQAGEKSALGLLFGRYYERVRRIVGIRASALGRGAADIDDVVQDTFLAAMRAFDRFEVREEFRLVHWLARIAEHKLIDVLKRESSTKRDRARELSLEALLGSGAGHSSLAWDLAADSTPVSVRAEQAELVGILDRHIAKLDERYREAILLKDFTGASFKFIADEMGCVSAEAARKLYGRARVALASLLPGHL